MQMPWWSEITFRTGNPLNISSHHRSGIAVSSIPVGERVTVNLERKLIPRAAGCQSASKFDPPLECAPGAGQFGELGFQRMKAMARQRSHSIDSSGRSRKSSLPGRACTRFPSGMISRDRPVEAASLRLDIGRPPHIIRSPRPRARAASAARSSRALWRS